MFRTSALQVLVLASLAAYGSLAALDYTQPPPNLNELAGAELYWTWRPTSHIAPLYGRMLDPCMHYADTSTGLFQVGYLWPVGPRGVTAVRTDDLVTFTDVNEGGAHIISPGDANDPVDLFDGSIISNGVDGLPTLIYAGVKYLPITWSMVYVPESETQSLAVSRDAGKTFEKLDMPPVITQPVSENEPTAFRDPYFFRSYQLDEVLASDRRWYVVVAGGVKGANRNVEGWGPGQFLYRQTAADDFVRWEYLGNWWKQPANASSSANKWGVNSGFNQEVSNLAHLGTEGVDNTAGELFVTHGAEWADEWDGVVHADAPSWRGEFHRDMNWSAGKVTRDATTGLPRFTPTMSSRLDWGRTAYAAAAQVLPATARASVASGTRADRWISFVWLNGDCFEACTPPAAQKWASALTYPRELTVGHIDGVVDNALAREAPGAWVVESEDPAARTVRLRTLRQVIAREPRAALTDGRRTTAIVEPGRTVRAPGLTPFARSPASRHFTLSANLTFPGAGRTADFRAGFEILANEHERTTLWYQLSNDTVYMDRAESSAAAATTGTGFDLRFERGLFRLFDIQQDATTQMVETMQLTVTVDNAFVEVHANDRFVLSSWVKPWYANSTGISFYTDGEGEVTFSDVTIHEGLINAFPGREDPVS